MKISSLNALFDYLQAGYTLTDKMPASGQREVFLARRKSDGIPCVVKLSGILAVHVARIQREIGILERLDSAYFPRFYAQSFVTNSILEDFLDHFDPRDEGQREVRDRLRAENIQPFLLTAEEFIPHLSWEGCRDRLQEAGNLVDLLIHLFRALSLLWQEKIVHRDLKPENILLRENLQPVIIDLGIAKSFRAGTRDLTVLGTPCTPSFAAPEQLLNIRADITYKTDQFAVGVIAYHLLTGRFPYGNVHEIGIDGLVANLSGERLVPIHRYNGAVHPRLAQFIERLLQVRPYRRFRHGETILQQLQEIREALT